MRNLIVRSLVMMCGIALVSGCATTPKNSSANAGKKNGESGEAAPKPPAEDVAAAPVEPAPKVEEKAAPPSGNKMVTSAGLNVRKGPGNEFAVVRTLKHGEAVQVLQEVNKFWAKISEGEFVAIKFLGDRS